MVEGGARGEARSGSASRGGRRRRSEGAGGAAVVVDASAILAVLYGEPGEDEIRRRMGGGVRALVSAVNLSEVAAKLAEGGFDEREAREAVGVLGLEVAPFGRDSAYLAGMLRPQTRERGMGLADRACVAVARGIGTTAVTTDGSWDGLEGVEVVVRHSGADGG